MSAAVSHSPQRPPRCSIGGPMHVRPSAPSLPVQEPSDRSLTASVAAADNSDKATTSLTPGPVHVRPTAHAQPSSITPLLHKFESIGRVLSRSLSSILFSVWLICGLPLLFLLYFVYDPATQEMKAGPCHPLILLVSFSWLINVTLILAVMHGLGMVDPDLTAWQAASLGWALGVSAVTYLQAALDGGTSEAVHRVMLRPFGIRIEPGGEGNTVGWFPTLVAIVPALVWYFFVAWFGEVREGLACVEVDDVDGSAGYNSTDSTSGCPPSSLPSPNGTLCCHVVDETFNWLEFAAYLAGSVLAGWAVIRFVALFLIWGDDEIQLEVDDGYRIQSEKVDRLREVMMEFSRGALSREEIELRLEEEEEKVALKTGV